MLKSEWHRFCMKNNKFYSTIYLMSNINKMLLILPWAKSYFTFPAAKANEKKTLNHIDFQATTACTRFLGRLVYLCLKSEIVRNSWQIENSLLTHKNHMQHKDDEKPGKMLKRILARTKKNHLTLWMCDHSERTFLHLSEKLLKNTHNEKLEHSLQQHSWGKIEHKRQKTLNAWWQTVKCQWKYHDASGLGLRSHFKKSIVMNQSYESIRGKSETGAHLK